jgi:hypothetical protein
VRSFALTTVKAGMTRLRDKGGANKDSLYTLDNAYVTASRSVKPRPGAKRAYTLPAGTKGLMAFRDHLHVFSSEIVTSTDPFIIIDVLRHPDENSSATLTHIHFAQPFLGYPYVVAEFSDDDETFYHFWLQETGLWLANHVYIEGEVIQPTVPNGYAYQATRLTPAAPLWAPNEPRATGDTVEPTTANGYQYEVIDTIGTNPASGSTEPAWIAEDGAIVYEDVTGQTGGGGTTPDGGSTTPPPDVQERYRNQGGYNPNNNNPPTQAQ